MRNFQGTFETSKQSFISAFLICMTVPLRHPEFNVAKISVISISVISISICNLNYDV